MKSAVVLLLFSSALVACGPPSEKSKARDVINACWEEQKRKSLDSAEARFIAGVCESKERDFRAKYGLNP